MDSTELEEMDQDDEDYNPVAWFFVHFKHKATDFMTKLVGKPEEDEEFSPAKEKEKEFRQMKTMFEMYRGAFEDDTESAVVWVDSEFFDIGMCTIIIINVVAITLEADLGQKRASGGRQPFWIAIEAVLALFFITEVCLKCHYHSIFWNKKWRWIVSSGSNFFLTGVAFMSLCDVIILAPLGSSGGLRLLSLFRVFGLLRLYRLIQKYRALEELRLMLKTMENSLSTLVWSVVLLFLVDYVAAILLTQEIGQNEAVYGPYRAMSGGWSNEDHFGTIPRSLYTMFRVMTLEHWSSDVARHVVANQWWMSIFFIIFLLITSFGIFNIVISVIVEQTLMAAMSNRKKLLMREEAKKRKELHGIKEIFLMSDTDGSGKLSHDEFMEAAKQPEVQWRMRQMELPIDDAGKLFEVMGGDGTRELDIDEFIEGCSKLKGQAQSRDLLRVQAQADSLADSMGKLADSVLECERMLNALDEVTMRFSKRFDSAILGSRRKIAQTVGGSKPIVPIPKEGKTGDKVPLSIGNRPALPQFPNLL